MNWRAARWPQQTVKRLKALAASSALATAKFDHPSLAVGEIAVWTALALLGWGSHLTFEITETRAPALILSALSLAVAMASTVMMMREAHNIANPERVLRRNHQAMGKIIREIRKRPNDGTKELILAEVEEVLNRHEELTAKLEIAYRVSAREGAGG